MKKEQQTGSSLIPMYRGDGPNLFREFMDSEVRKSIVRACYDEPIAVQKLVDKIGVSLQEINIEIEALIEKRILIREGEGCRTNVILITEDCDRETDRVSAKYHEMFADALDSFLQNNTDKFKSIGFYGSLFTENSIRWMLASLVFREILGYKKGRKTNDAPETAWGERAHLYFVEKYRFAAKQAFEICGLVGKNKDRLLFCNFVDAPRGSHHDFYGDQRAVNQLCDIARGCYDDRLARNVEAAEELERLGYVIRNNGSYLPTMPIYTKEQYQAATALAKRFSEEILIPMLESMTRSLEKAISDRAPKNLHEQISGVISIDVLADVVTAPTKLLIQKGCLSTNWDPREMPTVCIVLES